ncbi:hypothetical protein Tco_1494061 [Tanacetum coccineum]
MAIHFICTVPPHIGDDDSIPSCVYSLPALITCLITMGESDPYLEGNMIKKVYATMVDLTGQVLRGKSARNDLVRQAKFYSATAVIVGVSKIKAFGCVHLCTIYSFRPKKLISKTLKAAKQCDPSEILELPLVPTFVQEKDTDDVVATLFD